MGLPRPAPRVEAASRRRLSTRPSPAPVFRNDARAPWCQTEHVKIKNRDSGETLKRALLIIEDGRDVQALRDAFDAWERHHPDTPPSFVIPIPVPGSQK